MPKKSANKAKETASCRKNKVRYVMGEFKRGKLRTRVMNRKQAIAIALSEARRHCK